VEELTAGSSARLRASIQDRLAEMKFFKGLKFGKHFDPLHFYVYCFDVWFGDIANHPL